MMRTLMKPRLTCRGWGGGRGASERGARNQARAREAVLHAPARAPQAQAARPPGPARAPRRRTGLARRVSHWPGTRPRTSCTGQPSLNGSGSWGCEATVVTLCGPRIEGAREQEGTRCRVLRAALAVRPGRRASRPCTGPLARSAAAAAAPARHAAWQPARPPTPGTPSLKAEVESREEEVVDSWMPSTCQSDASSPWPMLRSISGEGGRCRRVLTAWQAGAGGRPACQAVRGAPAGGGARRCGAAASPRAPVAPLCRRSREDAWAGGGHVHAQARVASGAGVHEFEESKEVPAGLKDRAGQGQEEQAGGRGKGRHVAAAQPASRRRLRHPHACSAADCLPVERKRAQRHGLQVGGGRSGEGPPSVRRAGGWQSRRHPGHVRRPRTRRPARRLSRLTSGPPPAHLVKLRLHHLAPQHAAVRRPARRRGRRGGWGGGGWGGGGAPMRRRGGGAGAGWPDERRRPGADPPHQTGGSSREGEDLVARGSILGVAVHVSAGSEASGAPIACPPACLPACSPDRPPPAAAGLA